MKTNLFWTTLLALVPFSSTATEFHVALNGNDAAPGTKRAPLRHIQRAAELAQPGDTITVHQGVYREWVNPPRGGESESRRIVYRAAQGEKVEVTGSEEVKGWEKVQVDLWKVTLPNSFFGEFNPYSDLIHGDWFDPRGREHHTGAVYLNGDWLTEAARLEEVEKPVGATPLWYGQVGKESTTIWAQFKGVNPNEQLVEINVRRAVFYPDKPGRNFITVRGFILRQAATPWAPPTAEQVGLIGTHWSKGWIIENNKISYSICSGVSLGKYGDQWDNTSANTAEGYVKTIERALQNGWNKETIGHHLVRNNEISHCEQAGIVGSLGAAFSVVSGNSIHDIHVRRLFSGAEMAGIKFHAAIDTVIRHNHVYRTCRGLWLDWMAQGTRVSGNLFHENASEDLFVEVDHGPFVVDNNLFLSGTSLLDMSEGGAYAHNLFAGKLICRPEPNRQTPYHPAHTTTVAGLIDIKGGDDRFYNNIFVGDGHPQGPAKPDSPELQWRPGFGLWIYDGRGYPLQTGGNIYYHGALPYGSETNNIVSGGFDPKLKLEQEGESEMFRFSPGACLEQARMELVTTQLLGRSKVAGLVYENANAKALKLDRDYLGRKRNDKHPVPGPFEQRGASELVLKVW